MEMLMTTLHQQIQSAGHKVYGSVNRMWPDELPILEKIEAERAYKRLITKFGTKQVWSEYSNKWITEKKSVRRTRKNPAEFLFVDRHQECRSIIFPLSLPSTHLLLRIFGLYLIKTGYL